MASVSPNGAYVCARCRRRRPWEASLWRCPACGGPLELAERPPFRPDAVRPDEPTLWRYRAMIPLPPPLPQQQPPERGNAEPVSLGEGGTPLVEVELPEGAFLAKLEFLMPTGSFKDRGTAALVSCLRAWGVERVHDDSSGNAAASLAAYCARAGIACTLYVPASASPAKLGQIEAYGARLVRVAGPREAATKAAEEAARRGGSVYASHAYHPFILEGTKTLAYELWEQRAVPDALVLPTGHGTLLLGAYRGFLDLKTAGLIERLPRLVAAQAAACAPLRDAVERGLDDVPPEWAGRPSGATVAEGLRIPRPPRAPEILRALRETGGAAVAVDDDEIVRAREALARRGILVEPTSAVAVAGWRKLIAQGVLGATERVVIPLTGSGLKALPLSPPSAPAG